MAGLDLARTSVFLDFDGTLTPTDTGVRLLERLAPAEWRSLDTERLRREAGTRACLLDQWELLPHDESVLRDALGDVVVDPDARGLVDDLRAAGAEVVVVSDGFGFFATEVAEALGVPVLTNAVDWTTGRLEFPHEERCCACSSCGVCKQAPIKDARHRGRSTVLVGDDATDHKAALLADLVLAKGALARWCGLQGVPFLPFATLADVRVTLREGSGAPIGSRVGWTA
ncbi:MAG: HAD-IB family phosphatase [Actinomycetota bacterium]